MLNSAQKKPRSNQSRHAEASNSPEPDLIIGGENIIKETGQNLNAFYYWAPRGMYGDAVWKAGHKTWAASRRRLRELGKPSP